MEIQSLMTVHGQKNETANIGLNIIIIIHKNRFIKTDQYSVLVQFHMCT